MTRERFLPISGDDMKRRHIGQMEILLPWNSARVKMIWADLDNDGVEDIYAEVDFGGSGPFGE